MSSEKLFSVIILGLILALAASVYTQGFSKLGINFGTKHASTKVLNEAKDKALEFIKKNGLVAPNTKVEIEKISEEDDFIQKVAKNGLYELSVKVGGSVYTAYMTKDYSVFFPSAFDMNKSKEDAKSSESQKPEKKQEFPKSEKPKVQLFTMAFCPYGSQAEDLMRPVVELLGDAISYEPHYIFDDNDRGDGSKYCLDSKNRYCSMHGAGEAKEDIRELCVFNQYPDKFWEFISAINKDCKAGDVESCWSGVAKKLGIDTDKIETCFKSNKLSYAESERKLTNEHNITGSPTLLINGTKYQGPRTSEDYKNAICSAFKNPPQICGKNLNSGSSSNPASGKCGS